jgi:hypothetical protein
MPRGPIVGQLHNVPAAARGSREHVFIFVQHFCTAENFSLHAAEASSDHCRHALPSFVSVLQSDLQFAPAGSFKFAVSVKVEHAGSMMAHIKNK